MAPSSESTSTLPINRLNGADDTNIQTNIIPSGKMTPDVRFPLNGISSLSKLNRNHEDVQDEDFIDGVEHKQDGDPGSDEDPGTERLRGPTDDEDQIESSGTEEDQTDMESQD